MICIVFSCFAKRNNTDIIIWNFIKVPIKSLQFLSMVLYQGCMLLEVAMCCWYGNEVIYKVSYFQIEILIFFFSKSHNRLHNNFRQFSLNINKTLTSFVQSLINCCSSTTSLVITHLSLVNF